MNDHLIRFLRQIVTNVVAPLVGLGGIITILSNPSAPERPTLVLACLVLIGYPIAGLADRKRVEEEGSPK